MGTFETTMVVDIRGVVSPLEVETYDSETLIAIEGATVKLSRAGSYRIKTTDASGKASFNIVETDSYTINVSKAGYVPQERTVTLYGPYENIMEVDIRARIETTMEVEITA